MCDVAPETIPFQPNLGKKAGFTDSLVKRAPTMAEFGAYSYDERKTKESGDTEYSKLGLDVIANDLITKKHNYIGMLNPPEISGSFSENLDISPEIKVRLESNAYFKYALYNIFNLLEDSLNKVKKSYRISVKLEVDKNDSEWERADITIRFKEDLENIRSLWKDIISEESKFYKSLSNKTAFPECEVNNLRKFIYILVDTEE